MATIRIGISGWRYPPWRGTFYPKDLPQKAELEYASGILPVIEINGSFYSLQRPTSYASWYKQTPADFLFTVKGPRFITHMRRLNDVAEPVANFLASGLFNLREKLGPLLWQFPPNFTYDRARMEAFFELLPHDTESAAVVARKRSAWMKGRDQLEIDEKRVLRHAVEIRNETFLDPTFIDLLRAHNIALVIAETARTWPMPQDITADFLYMRLHGDKELYKSGYSDRSLDRWAARISAWHAGSEPPGAERVSKLNPPTSNPRDVYCFFDNTDVKLRAPFDSQTLMRKLGLREAGGEVGATDPAVQQGSAPSAKSVKSSRSPKSATRVDNARTGTAPLSTRTVKSAERAQLRPPARAAKTGARVPLPPPSRTAKRAKTVKTAKVAKSAKIAKSATPSSLSRTAKIRRK